MEIKSQDKTIMTGYLAKSGDYQGLYVLDLEVVPPIREPESKKPALLVAQQPWFTKQLIHARLGHPSKTIMKSIITGDLVEGLEKLNLKEEDNRPCYGCLRGKFTRRTFKRQRGPIQSLRSKRILGLLHMDLVGQMKIETPFHELYALTVEDDFSGKSWVVLLKLMGTPPWP